MSVTSPTHETHWHDTPQFERIRDRRVDALLATDDDEATHCCRHFLMATPDGKPLVEEGAPMYFMRAPNSERSWFLCRDCCRRDVELELLTLEQPPSEAEHFAGGGSS
jgi:hypothetical protein